MSTFTEQQRRSVAKTLTVRVCFTLSHLLNGYIVTGALILGAQIAGVAALVNMLLFWAHERVWNFVQWNRKPKDTAMFLDGQPRTISKSITWRLVITINNFLIPYLLTGSWKTAAAFLGLATIMNIIVYYTHERVWNMVTWGKAVNE